MELLARIHAFACLGKRLDQYLLQAENKEVDPEFETFHQLVGAAYAHNNWFTQQEVLRALQGLKLMLNQEDLQAWTNEYELSEALEGKTVGIIMAGNIPLVGFHDLLCVLMAGSKAQVKLSSDDRLLLPAMFSWLNEAYPELIDRISWVEKLSGFDAVIATGSNNSARYFEAYFGKYPNIIRKNRTSVAILEGDESAEDLQALGNDVFNFFGLGCRNVTKVYLPQEFKLDHLFEAFLPFQEVMQNNKYMNNYNYNQTLYLMKNEPILDNGFLVLKEDEAMHSPIGTLFYERYDDLSKLKAEITKLSSSIQCVVSRGNISFGQAQSPGLKDYADGIDTMHFLSTLS